MAKPPSAAAAAPAGDAAPADENVGEGDDAPKGFRLRLPQWVSAARERLPRWPFRIALPRKWLIIGAASVAGLGAIGAAAYAFWPEPPQWPRQALPKKKQRVKPPAAAASATPVEVAALAASAPLPAADAASGPEDPMDTLRRRLGETLGANGKLENDGPGELRLTSRGPAASASAVADAPATQPAAAAPAPRARRAQVPAIAWSYDGAGGPAHWGRLKPEFARCGSGTRQSPIDIRDGIDVQMDPVRFDYRPSAFRVIDNGHTVRVNVAPGNHLEVMGRRYELQQFHFHRPSEERIDGVQYDMSAHLVHQDEHGRVAIVAVLLERGGAQPVVQMVWNNLPLEKHEEQPAQSPMDLAQLLPTERGYFTYMGSLTTPPCSEGVLWIVMKEPVPVSEPQIGIFSRLYPMNARPVQSASGRLIKASN